MQRSIIFAPAVLLLGIFVAAAPAYASMALDDWNMEARNALPAYLKLWLFSMLITHFSSIFFIRNHVPARWVLGGFVLSHAWVAYAEYSGVISLKAGLVSLGHILFWAPAIISFYRNRADIKLFSSYGIWVCIMFFFYTISLTFDIRDAVIYLEYII